MHIKTLSANRTNKGSLFTYVRRFLQRTFKWHWLSILLLGISANLLINAVLDYKYQRPLISFSLEEYINAIIGAYVFLKGTRWVARKLDKRVPWVAGVRKRLLLQLTLQLLYIIVSLNTLLVSITYFFYGGFYAWDELALINVCVVSLTFFFSSIDSGIYFFNNWKILSGKKKGAESVKPLQISLGKVQYLIEQNSIQLAISIDATSYVITSDGRKLLYPKSLDALISKLESSHFFRANRQVIVSRTIVKAIKSLEHGKVEVNLMPVPGAPVSITVSRIKAAEFRKWLKAYTV